MHVDKVSALDNISQIFKKIRDNYNKSAEKLRGTRSSTGMIGNKKNLLLDFDRSSDGTGGDMNIMMGTSTTDPANPQENNIFATEASAKQVSGLNQKINVLNKLVNDFIGSFEVQKSEFRSKISFLENELDTYKGMSEKYPTFEELDDLRKGLENLQDENQK
jgi:DNA polymerase II small subunit/DNA polymerase delta subunit B